MGSTMAGPPDFSIGAVIRRTVDILGGDMPRFLGIALMFELLPQLVSLALSPVVASAPDPAPGGAAPFATFPLGIIVFMVAVVGKGAAAAATLATCEGRPWTVGSAVRIGAAAFPSNLGLLILDYLGVGLASLLLVFPGLMLLCRWIVALPVNMAERPGVRAALGRSRDLTDGHRWPIFGLLLLFGLLSAVVPIAALLLGLRQGIRPGDGAGALVSALSATAFSLVGNVGMAVLYVELRAAKGEAPPPGLVSAFE